MDDTVPVDTIDASTFLRSVNQANGSFVEHFVMPVTGFENAGQAVTPTGFDSSYGMYLTIDATGSGASIGTLNVTLWADPQNDDGTADVSVGSDPAFSDRMDNDIVLATGSLVSAAFSQDPTTGTRFGDFVERMTPTLEGTVLLHGSIGTGSLLEEKLTTPASVRASVPQTDGTTINTVTGGSAEIALDPQDTIQIPDGALFGNGHHHFHGHHQDDAVSFDQFDLRTYTYNESQADTSTNVTMVGQVTGFERGGLPVTMPGFETDFGMYFIITGTALSPPGAVATFTTMNIALMVDPGDNDGAVSSSAVNRIGFANGKSGDYAVATGTLVSATVSAPDANGTRHPDFTQSMTPTAAGERLFGGSLNAGDLMREMFTTPGGPQIFPQSGGGVIQVVNGTGTGVAALSPRAPLTLHPDFLS